MLYLDFETYSEADITKVGAQNYMEHESTRILVLAWAIDDGPVTSWMPEHPELSRVDLREALRVFNSYPHGEYYAAHHAAFDLLAMDLAHHEYGFPVPAPCEWIDTATVARINGYPGGLADACNAVGTEYRKNPSGGRLITTCCTPRGRAPLRSDYEELRDYCESDVEAMRSLVQCLRPMSYMEHEDWLVTYSINQRGVHVSLEDIETAMAAADQINERINAELTVRTEGKVTRASQVKRAKDWLKHEGKLDKGARRTMVAAGVSDEVYEVLDLIDEGNLTSLAKYEKLKGYASWDDHRVRGALVHAGAGQTQRFSSRGVQLHNFRRDAYAPAEAAGVLDSLDSDTDLSELGKLLRNVITPAEGYVLVVGDWSSIEARVLPWLAGAEHRLDLFREGRDLYQVTADQMKVDRQVGKVAELALGFGGGVGAFERMAELYDIEVPDPKYIVDRWRAANGWVVQFWRDIAAAAMNAMQHPGHDFSAGRFLTYHYVPQARTLTVTLPDGTMLHYPQPKVIEGKYSYDIEVLKASVRPRAGRKWPRQRLWHGLLVENVTQAVAACVLRETLREPFTSDHVVMHVHDEIVLEVPEDDAEMFAGALGEAMSETPSWAPGLPLEAKPVVMERYGKT